jgi:hypothetical protein
MRLTIAYSSTLNSEGRREDLLFRQHDAAFYLERSDDSSSAGVRAGHHLLTPNTLRDDRLAWVRYHAQVARLQLETQLLGLARIEGARIGNRAAHGWAPPATFGKLR